jgi:hypothetical protein
VREPPLTDYPHYYLGKGKTYEYEKGNRDKALYYAGLTGFDCLIDLESDEQSIGRRHKNIERPLDV